MTKLLPLSFLIFATILKETYRKNFIERFTRSYNRSTVWGEGKEIDFPMGALQSYGLTSGGALITAVSNPAVNNPGPNNESPENTYQEAIENSNNENHWLPT